MVVVTESGSGRRVAGRQERSRRSRGRWKGGEEGTHGLWRRRWSSEGKKVKGRRRKREEREGRVSEVRPGSGAVFQNCFQGIASSFLCSFRIAS